MKNKTKNRRNNSGFTLIEMIVAVSIVSILTSIAAPSFRAMIENNKASVEANELVSGLLLARSEALKRRNNVTICTSIDQTTCAGNGVKNFSKGWIVFQDCDNDQVLDLAPVDCGGAAPQLEVIIKAQAGTKKMETKRGGAALNQHFFTYNFTGRANGATTTFTVTREGSSVVLKQVIVALTGRVRTI